MIKQGSFAYSCDSVRLLNRRKLFLRGVGLRPVQVLPGNTDRGQIFTLLQRDREFDRSDSRTMEI
jgi:hypothetical protein